MHTAQKFTEKQSKTDVCDVVLWFPHLFREPLVLPFEHLNQEGLSTWSVPASWLKILSMPACGRVWAAWKYRTLCVHTSYYSNRWGKSRCMYPNLHVFGPRAVPSLSAECSWTVLSAAHLWAYLHLSIKYAVLMLLITKTVQCSLGLSVSRLLHWFVMPDSWLLSIGSLL